MSRFKIDTSSRGGRALALVFATLLVTAALGPFVSGTARAQTDTTEYVVGGNYPKYISLETGNMTGGTYEVEVLVDASEIPGRDNGTVTLVRKELATSGDKDSLVFKNLGAYQTLTFRVTPGSGINGAPVAKTGLPSGILDTSIGLGSTGGDADLKCDTDESVSQMLGANIVDCNLPSQQVTGTAAQNISDTDAYAHALSIRDDSSLWNTTQTNFRTGYRAGQFAKGKIIVNNYIVNGSSASQAKVFANETVNDEYTARQMNIIQAWNNRISSIRYISNTTSNLRTANSGNTFPESLDFQTGKSVALANGTTVNVTVARFDNNGWRVLGPSFVDQSTVSGTWLGDGYWFEIQNPDNSNWVRIFGNTEYSLHYDYSSTDTQTVKDNIAVYADGAYSEWQAGQLNATDLAKNSPLSIALEASTSYASTGYYSLGSTALAALGAGGDINASHTIETNSSVTYNGTLFYTGNDRENFSTGSTIDPATGNGSWYIVYQQANSTGYKHLTEQFTVTNATNTKTGEAVNETTLTQYTTESTNTSQLAAEIDRLTELREQYEEALAATSGGGGGGFSFGDVGTQGIAIVALAGAGLYLLGKDNSAA